MDNDGGGMVLNLEMPYEPKVQVWAAVMQGIWHAVLSSC